MGYDLNVSLDVPTILWTSVHIQRHLDFTLSEVFVQKGTPAVSYDNGFSACSPHVLRILSAYDRSIYEQPTVHPCLTMLPSQTFAYRFCHSPIPSGNMKLYCKADTFDPIFPLENQHSRNTRWKNTNCLVIPFSNRPCHTCSVTKYPIYSDAPMARIFQQHHRINTSKHDCDYLPDFLITSQN